MSVSYTHLDVYKRQAKNDTNSIATIKVKHNLKITIIVQAQSVYVRATIVHRYLFTSLPRQLTELTFFLPQCRIVSYVRFLSASVMESVTDRQFFLVNDFYMCIITCNICDNVYVYVIAIVNFVSPFQHMLRYACVSLLIAIVDFVSKPEFGSLNYLNFFTSSLCLNNSAFFR